MFKSIKFIGLAAFLGSCGIVDSKYEEYETPETTEPPTTDECTKGLEAFAPIQAFIDSQCLSCHGDSGVGAGSLLLASDATTSKTNLAASSPFPDAQKLFDYITVGNHAGKSAVSLNDANLEELKAWEAAETECSATGA